MKRRLHSCYLFQAALLCVFGFPDTRAQIPCYLRLDAMRWLLKTALPAAFFVRRDRKSSTRFRCSGRKTGIFDAETGSQMTAHTTIQSSQTGETVRARKEAVSAGIFDGIVRFFRSPEKPAVSWAYCGL
jgi:hypothetical protein